MDSITDYSKQEALIAMYQSVDRMNQHILNDNTDGIVAEQNLQKNFRSIFEELS